MIEALSTAFVIAFLVLLVVISGCASFLCVLAEKSRLAVGWFVACLVSAGILMSILGGI